MTFGAMAAWPGWLLLAGATALAIVIFRLKVRPRKVRVPSLLFWSRVLNDAREMTLWERIRRAVSLVITAAIAIALVLALLRPSGVQGATGAAVGRSVIVECKAVVTYNLCALKPLRLCVEFLNQDAPRLDVWRVDFTVLRGVGDARDTFRLRVTHVRVGDALARADLALSASEIKIEGDAVTGVAHNIGAAAANCEVALIDPNGKVVARQALGEVAAPLDLTPQRKPFRLSGVRANTSGWKVALDVEGKIAEIYEGNNSVDLPAR
jgi:hypothetical protein